MMTIRDGAYGVNDYVEIFGMPIEAGQCLFVFIIAKAFDNKALYCRKGFLVRGEVELSTCWREAVEILEAIK